MSSPSRQGEIVEQEVEGKIKRFKIVEHVVDGNNTVVRKLVPADISEDDIPEGSTLLDENETAGLLAKQAKPDNIRVGDPVRLRKGNTARTGTVSAKLKSGRLKVSWIDNTETSHEVIELTKVY